MRCDLMRSTMIYHDRFVLDCGLKIQYVYCSCLFLFSAESNAYILSIISPCPCTLLDPGQSEVAP